MHFSRCSFEPTPFKAQSHQENADAIIIFLASFETQTPSSLTCASEPGDDDCERWRLFALL